MTDQRLFALNASQRPEKKLPETSRSASEVFRTASGSFRSAPQSFITAPEVFRSAPEVLRTAPESFITAPGVFRSAPQSLKTAPEIFRTSPQSASTSPQVFRTSPESAKMCQDRLLRERANNTPDRTTRPDGPGMRVKCRSSMKTCGSAISDNTTESNGIVEITPAKLPLPLVAKTSSPTNWPSKNSSKRILPG